MKYLRTIVVLLIIASLAITFTVGAKNILVKSIPQKLNNAYQSASAVNFNANKQLSRQAPIQLPLNADLYFAFIAIIISGGYLIIKRTSLR